MLIFQFVSYYTIGKESLRVHYFDYFKSLAIHTGEIGIYLEKEMSDSEKRIIESKLENRYDSVSFTNDSIVAHEKFYDESEILMLDYRIEYEFPFHALIYEGNGSYGYAETWTSEFYWILGKWVLINRTNTGQS
jgi:hypothetical protein